MAIDGKKVIEYMRAKNYRILALNIVYLEDLTLPALKRRGFLRPNK